MANEKEGKFAACCSFCSANRFTDVDSLLARISVFVSLGTTFRTLPLPTSISTDLLSRLKPLTREARITRTQPPFNAMRVSLVASHAWITRRVLYF